MLLAFKEVIPRLYSDKCSLENYMSFNKLYIVYERFRMKNSYQKNILGYWKYMCQFSPVAVQGNRNQSTRWEKNGYEYFTIDQFTENYYSCKKEGYFLEVVCGNVGIQELYRMLSLDEESFVEDETGRNFIFTALYDETGTYINKSFQIANFLLLMLSLSEDKWNQINNKISEEFNEKLDLWIQENAQQFNPDMLKLLVNEVFKQLNLASNVIQEMQSADYGLYIKRHKDNQDDRDRILEDSIIQMDFYSEELAMILEKGVEESSILDKLLQKATLEKTRVDDNEQFIRKRTKPRNYPLVKWPSKYNPSLMQTVAINIATSENPEDILAVNGPPGTGKTTLLKEIIAHNIFEKAKIISKLKLNSTTRKQIISAESYYKDYYQLPRELKKLGIIVASNNNAAVENITKDLPKGTDLYSENTFTEYFDNRKEDEIYFTESAKKLFEDEDVWGLISAPYGKSSNINKLKSVISAKHGSGKDIFSTTNDKNVDFKDAKEEFNLTLKKVESYQQELDEKVKKIFELENNYLNDVAEGEMYYRALKSYIEEYSTSPDDLPVCISQHFFNDFTNNEYAQVASPWITSEWNKLREELFYKSLKLIKSYIQNATGIKKNLSIFCAIRNNEKTGYTQEEKSKVFKECYHTLNLLIPVLSTTFASVKRAFEDFGANELGMVIIDEAGQASPYSAAGLLYRAQRCIVVGDPLQVEPVVAIPETLNHFLFKKFNIHNIEKEFVVSVDGAVKRDYKHTALSIQTLADASSIYYGKIGEMEVGCPLVVHRRCEYPMFEISNKISYDNRMINKCIKDKKNLDNYVIQKSVFIDINGKEKGEKNHYVTEQGVEVIRIINEALVRGIDVFGNDKALYIISPFKTVINNLKVDLKKAYQNQPIDKECFNKWLDNALGTVHKFQGKEADSVIMILGCDSSSQGAANWAAQQANILNVAVTRAKRRIALIGDKNLWKKQPYFEDAIEILDKVE